MFLNELAESRLLVIFAGRFQPFHQGHAWIYNQCISRFGRNNVYVVTTGQVDPGKTPFDQAERMFFMNLQGVPTDRIKQVKTNYNIEAIQAAFDIQTKDLPNYKIIFVVSQKDVDEKPNLFAGGLKKDGTPAKLQPLPSDLSAVKSADQHGYILAFPVKPFMVLGQECSGATDIRRLYAPADKKTRQQIIIDVFGKYSQEAEQIFNKKLVPGQAVQPPKLANQAKLQKVGKPQPVDEGTAFAQQDPATQAGLAKFKTDLHRQEKPINQPLPAQTPATEPESLAVLKQRRDRLEKLAQIKQDLEQAQEKVSKKFGGELPPGMAADLTDYYTMDDVDTHFPEMLAAYQKQYDLLDAFIKRRKGLFKSPVGLKTGVKLEAEKPLGFQTKSKDDYYYKFLAYKYNRDPGSLSKAEKTLLQDYLLAKKVYNKHGS